MGGSAGPGRTHPRILQCYACTALRVSRGGVRSLSPSSNGTRATTMPGKLLSPSRPWVLCRCTFTLERVQPPSHRAPAPTAWRGSCAWQTSCGRWRVTRPRVRGRLCGRTGRGVLCACQWRTGWGSFGRAAVVFSSHRHVTLIFPDTETVRPVPVINAAPSEWFYAHVSTRSSPPESAPRTARLEELSPTSRPLR